MTIFLLCDFGKINLKTATKSRKWYNAFVKNKPNTFTEASGLKPPSDLATDIIHDKITHMKIPKSISGWLDKKIGSKTEQSTPFIALNKAENWKDKSKYNTLTEYIANGVEANKRYGTDRNISSEEGRQAYSIGRALRKKKLNNEQKILTNLAGAAATGDRTRINLLKQITKKTEADPRDLQNAIDDFKDLNGGNNRYSKKVKGTKPTTTIEEKKSNLKQKYGIA